ncbi:Helix-turn-helix domain-containing protein [Actinacidiphila yanglinensis]|uniref:Helix-turn-helix domain-containing protein n=1 Tax=Actinacidiphila yanglinensis TaxID=310779 RepID=A0A1H6DJ82_9ACTN|nr:helix-turn-helix domain-containing protein [Actinacidiphila yanglinensis]SEG85272.1 Helix-turn-helix domain-containing protein [Actinacidiphila yanglinensis]SEG91076.1 Helix-turn-helix domain-containing protein [Actinacidiphila yanglinensis]
MLLTTGQAAAELGCAVTTFRRLIHAGLLPGLSRHGVRVMVPLEVVMALKDRPVTDLRYLQVPEIAVLRADVAPAAVRPGEYVQGFSASLPPDELLAALQGRWRCNPASVAAGGILPVTLSGYVVAVLSGLQQWTKDSQGRHGFPDAVLAGYVTDLATPTKHLTAPAARDRQAADRLLGTLLVSHSGGPVAYVPTEAPTRSNSAHRKRVGGDGSTAVVRRGVEIVEQQWK